MNMNDPLLGMLQYKEILKLAEKNEKAIDISGVSGSQRLHFINSICTHLNKKCVYILRDDLTAKKSAEELKSFFQQGVVFYPSKKMLLHNVEAESNDDEHQRITALQSMESNEYSIVVTSVEAVLQRTLRKNLFKKSLFKLEICAEFEIEVIIEKLISIGYERAGLVEYKGQFVVREE